MIVQEVSMESCLLLHVTCTPEHQGRRNDFDQRMDREVAAEDTYEQVDNTDDQRKHGEDIHWADLACVFRGTDS